MNKTNNDNKILKLQLFAVVAGVALLFAKFIAYFLSHSNTILTDALESIINVVAGAFALYSLYLSSKPKDSDHPYGHGKVEFISAGFEGILIALSGGVIIIKSVVSFFQPRTLEHLNFGLAVVVISGLINFLIGVLLAKAGETNKSLILKADGAHLKADAYSSVGILVGLLIVIYTGWNVIDNIVAIIFGCFIIYTGVRLIRQSVGGIMDEADEKIILAIVERLNAHRKPSWIDIHNLRIIQYGNKLHIDCHVTLPWYFTLEEAHREMEEISAVINKEQSEQAEFFIHGDPCIPASCKICMIEDCKVRKESFKQKIEWNIANVIPNKKHGL